MNTIMNNSTRFQWLILLTIFKVGELLVVSAGTIGIFSFIGGPQITPEGVIVVAGFAAVIIWLSNYLKKKTKLRKLADSKKTLHDNIETLSELMPESSVDGYQSIPAIITYNIYDTDTSEIFEKTNIVRIEYPEDMPAAATSSLILDKYIKGLVIRGELVEKTEEVQ